MRIKIGTLARIMDVSCEMIRKYEKQGLLEPKRDADGTNRIYEKTDLRSACLIKMYRKAGLSLQEVKALLATGDINRICELIERRMDEQQREILNIYSSMEVSKRILERVSTAKEMMNRFELAKSPHLLVLTRPPEEDQYASACAKRLANCMPVANCVSIWNMLDLDRPPEKYLCITAREAERIALDTRTMIHYYPHKSIHTAIAIRDIHTEREEIAMTFQAMQSYALDNQYRLAGETIGIELFSWNERERERGYLDVWAFIEK